MASVAEGGELRSAHTIAIAARIIGRNVAIIAQIVEQFAAAVIALLQDLSQRAHHRRADARMNRGIELRGGTGSSLTIL